MGKFRQRQYTPLKSTLNPFREIIIFIISLVLWVYCLTSIIVIGGSLLNIKADIVLLIRTVLNMEEAGMQAIFHLIVIYSIIIFLLFTISIIVRSFIKARGQKNEENN